MDIIEQFAIEKFFKKVAVEPNTGCLLWFGAHGKYGYGNLCVGKIHKSAHRYSWEMHRGPIPVGMWVLHKCDTPVCVNPDHLFLGSHKDNCADKVKKGRHLIGESVKNAKLNRDLVLWIRENYKKGDPEFGGAPISRKIGVTESAVSMVMSGKRWAAVKALEAAHG